MARIRTIKPEFPQSESMGRVSRDARLLFIMLWTMVDDEGRTRAAPRMLASLLYPYDEVPKTHIVEWLFELEREGAIRLYEVDGNAYLQIEKWLTHQKIDKPSKSRLPAPPEKILEHSPKPREDSTADLVPSTLEGTKDHTPPAGGAVVAKVIPEDFEEFWKAYQGPKNSKKPEALKAWAAMAKSRPPIADLLRSVANYNAWLAEEWRKNRREFPHKQHHSTWLRGEMWNSYGDGGQALTPEQIEINKDRADRLMRRGKYAEVMQ